jgi:hypothetical protein
MDFLRHVDAAATSALVERATARTRATAALQEWGALRRELVALKANARLAPVADPAALVETLTARIAEVDSLVLEYRYPGDTLNEAQEQTAIAVTRSIDALREQAKKLPPAATGVTRALYTKAQFGK